MLFIGVVAFFVLICINRYKGNMFYVVFFVPTVCCLLILEVKKVVFSVDCKVFW